MKQWRFWASLAALLWLTLAVALVFSTQRPIPAQVWWGMARTAWALAVAVGFGLLVWALGWWLAPFWGGDGDEQKAVLAFGVGMGVLAWVSLALEVLHWARPPVFWALAAAGMIWAVGQWRKYRPWSWRQCWQALPARGWWLAAGVPALLLALAPPEGFDALLYHLAQPAWVLKHGGLQTVPIYPFWHPGLVEGVYIWPLALGSDRAAQLLGLAFAAAALYLAAQWAQEVFGRRTAAMVVLLVFAMPSGLLLATGAYTDFALAFYSLAALRAAWRAGNVRKMAQATPALRQAAVFVGLAMSVKYTSVTLAVAVGGFLVWQWVRRFSWKAAARAVSQFAGLAVLVALPWYARNAYYMGNPFYPFVFGGVGWDAQRMAWLAEPGTGIGTHWKDWLFLPWTVSMGYRDATYFHSRIGPLFLGLAPLTLAAWFRLLRRGPRVRRAALVWGMFVGLSVLMWAWGVARSHALWQARLLWPALLVWAVPTAYGARWARVLDLPHLRVRYLVRWVVWGVAAVALLEAAVFVAARHPLAYALGFEDRASYYRRALPDYQDLSDLLAAHTPQNAKVMLLFEPRMYGLPREVMPDAFLDNFVYGLSQAGSPQALAEQWACEGYEAVALSRRGMDFLVENRPDKMTPARTTALRQFLQGLTLVAEQGDYALYRLPQPEHCPQAPAASP